jgi:ATP-binding cassette, subfamily C, bacterial CydC
MISLSRSFKLLWRLLTFLSPFRWYIALAILLGTLTIVSNIILLGMSAYLIAASALMPLLVTLMLPIYIVRFVGVSRAGARYTERLVSHNATFRLLANIRSWLYSRLEPLAPAHLLAYRSGDILTRFVADIEDLQNVYLRMVAPIIIAVVVALLTFCLFALFSATLAWVALTFLIATGFGVPLLAGWLARGLGKRQLALRAELNTQIVDSVQGIQDLLAYNRATDQASKIAELDRALEQVQQRMAGIAALQQGMHDLLTNLAVWTLLLLAIPLIVTKAIDGVYLGFLALTILASFEAAQPLAQALQSVGHSLAAAERLFAVADNIPQVVEPLRPLPTPLSDQPNALSLAFEHVGFAYDQGGQKVLDDITFHLCPGRRIAIVGPSGSGKSTLVRLALRFWDTTQGSVCLAGHNLRDYALDDLRAAISVVDQDTYLFNDTLRANLLLARPDASAEQLAQALEQAQLSAVIAQLPAGLETWIGEQGLRLSGGERQRLAIARALLKDAPLLILDEATANLDPQTERELLDALDTLMHGRTSLIITHRLVAMERMDEILVLDHGRIGQRGTHVQLVSEEGLYRQLFAIQNAMLVLS